MYSVYYLHLAAKEIYMEILTTKIKIMAFQGK
jgi:hypothetical protein